MTITETKKPQPIEEYVQERFAGDTAEHELIVLRDDGLYKHLRFKKPGTGMYRYDLVTWPGFLTFCGDMGTLVFARDEDMLRFFRSNPDRPAYRISADYWSEKVQDEGRELVRRFSLDVLKASIEQRVKDRIDYYPIPSREVEKLNAQLEQEVFAVFEWEGEPGGMTALRDFQFDWTDANGPHSFRFEDYYELDRTEWDFRYLWACHGIVTGIDKYDAHMGARVVDALLNEGARDLLGATA